MPARRGNLCTLRLASTTASTGEYYQYAYDAVGNRLGLTTTAGVVNYQHDTANHLIGVNGQAYTWDDNGNPSTGSGQACSRTGCAPRRDHQLRAGWFDWMAQDVLPASG